MIYFGGPGRIHTQIRTDATGLPVTITKHVEATTVGAAMAAFAGIDYYSSLAEARKSICSEEKTFKPGTNQGLYKIIFERHEKALEISRYSC